MSPSLADILHAKEPRPLAEYLVDQQSAPVPLSEVRFRAPVDDQEIWAAGVTYKRSQVARMEESLLRSRGEQLIKYDRRNDEFAEAQHPKGGEQS